MSSPREVEMYAPPLQGDITITGTSPAGDPIRVEVYGVLTTSFDQIFILAEEDDALWLASDATIARPRRRRRLIMDALVLGDNDTGTFAVVKTGDAAKEES